jgi:hypothetical protein
VLRRCDALVQVLGHPEDARAGGAAQREHLRRSAARQAATGQRIITNNRITLRTGFRAHVQISENVTREGDSVV